MTIVQNPWPFSHILTDEAKSSRPATANIPRTLAGNAALAQGMTIGGDLVDGAPNLAPLMGHGRGHDHSGGAGGAPLFRDVSNTSLADGETDFGAREFSVGAQFAKLLTTTQEGNVIGARVPEDEDFGIGFIDGALPDLWIPPCASDGAYHELHIRVCASLGQRTGTLLSGDVVTLYVRNLRPEVVSQANEVSMTFTGGTGNYGRVSANALRMRPGTYNRLGFSIQFTTASGGSARRASLGIWSISAGILSL